MSDAARAESLAALAILRERLLQAVEALDAAHAALVAETATTPEAPPPADAPSIADLARRFEEIRAQLSTLGVRAADGHAPPAPEEPAQ